MRKKHGCILMLSLVVCLMAGTLIRYQRHSFEERFDVPETAADTEKAGEGEQTADTGEGGQRTDGAGEAVDAEKNDETESESGKTADSDTVSEAQERAGMPIRVLLCSDSFESYYHQSETVEFQADYACLTPEGETVACPAGTSMGFGDDSEGTWIFTPVRENGGFCLPDLVRGYEDPVYLGSLEIRCAPEGLLLINILDVETYLGNVVPSEMPAGYPAEALKAQAVCARTYAYAHLESDRLEEFEADVDDSVQFQVYNNQPRDERTSQAVADTAGLVLKKDGELADARYYSTSCGLELTGDLSEEAVFAAFITASREDDYEREEPWYRWSTYFSMEELSGMADTAGLAVGELESIQVEAREESGRAETLLVKGTKGEARIEGEYEIRSFLEPAKTPVTLQDGETAPKLGMLPSAFFYLAEDGGKEEQKGYFVYGGGYGHGIGMSQNGAKNMAEAGKNFQEILAYYYDEVELDAETDTDH